MSNSGFQSLVSTLQATVQAINAVTQTISSATFQVWSAFVPVALADADQVAIDMSSGINFTLLATSAVGASRALANPTNAKVGQRGYIMWTQDAAGGRTLSYGTQYEAAGGVASLSPATSAYAVNVFAYVVIPGPAVMLTLSANVEH